MDFEGFGSEIKRRLKTDKMNVLITVIFPTGVKYLFRQLLSTFLLLFNALLKLRLSSFDKLTLYYNPKRQNSVQFHCKGTPHSNLFLEIFFDPAKLLFSVSIFRPDRLPFISRVFNAASREP